MRLLVTAGIFASLMAAVGPGTACVAAQPTFSIPKPIPSVGDVLTYQDSMASVACKSWRITATDQDGFVVSRCGDDTAYYLASNAALVRITGKDGKDLVHFTPFSPSVEFPLHVGKTWSAKYSGFTANGGSTWDSVQSCEVMDWQTVHVPAGAMAAFRIRCDDNWKSGPYAGTSKITSWYAPQAHAVVKTRDPADDKWNMDLVSYSNSLTA